MLRLYDEISSYEVVSAPVDSLALFDASYGDMYSGMTDELNIYDDMLVRIESKYKDILNMGYDVYYDDGTRITKSPSFDITDDTDVIANIVIDKNNPPVAYKIIININNLDVIPPNYYGNTR